MHIPSKRIEKVVLVNARNPEGISQFTFLDPMVPESLGIIGAQLKKQGCQVVWIDESIDSLYWRNHLWDLVEESDLFGVSAMTHTEDRAVQLAKIAKLINPHVITVAGGSGPTSNPEKALTGFDFVVMAQGVTTIIELLHLLRDGGETENVKGIAFHENRVVRFTKSREFLKTLTGVPFADFTILHNRHKLNVPVITNSLGCPFNCTYCYKGTMCGDKYLTRGVEEAADYLQYVSRFARNLWWTGGEKSIFLGDDNCAADIEWAASYFEKAAKLNLKNLGIGVQMRAPSCRNTDLLDIMGEAGVCRIFSGFESPFDRDLKLIRKNQSPEDILFAIEECKKRGIGIGAMMMWGLETHKLGDHLKYADFLLKHGVDMMLLFLFTPLPQTEDWKRIKSDGRILEKIPTRYYDSMHIVFKHPYMTPIQIQEAHLEAIVKFYGLKQAIRDVFKRRIKMCHLVYRFVGKWYLKAAQRETAQYIQKFLFDI